MTDADCTKRQRKATVRAAGGSRASLIALVGILVALGIAVPAAFDFLRDDDANRLLVVGVAIADRRRRRVLRSSGRWTRSSTGCPASLPRGRAALRVRRAGARDPQRLPRSTRSSTRSLLSFKDARAEAFVGLENYRFVFTDESMLRSLRNTAGWIVMVPLVAVSVGLAFATLADRLRRGEAVAKSLIFLPMAISFVGAAVTFRLIYSYRPEGFGTNIGLMNGIWQGLGNEPGALAVPEAVEQPAAHGDHGLDADRLRHGRAVGRHQVDPRRDHRGGPHRRRVRAAGVPPHHRSRASCPRSSWSPPTW